jgi:1-acyl-sn-glycerol-3-phosphate acyltransferase
MKTNFKFTVRYYFRRGFILGRKNIPQNTPVIFAANHPNSFMDAFVVGFITRKSINTLTRGDVFNHPVVSYFLSLFRLLPVYRREEGKSNLSKNDLTFKRCEELLSKNHNILIFSEGVSTVQKRLSKLRKGTARIAFQSFKNASTNIQVVPVGINYTYPDKAEEELILKFGEPLKLTDYIDLHDQNNARAINKLTKDLQKAIEDQMIIIENPDHEMMIEAVFRIVRNEIPNHKFKWMIEDETRFELEKKVSQRIHDLSISDPEKFEALSIIIHSYIQKLKSARLSDYGFSSGKLRVSRTFLGLLIGFPLFLPGYLIGFLPRKLGDVISVRTTKKAVEFLGAVNVSIRMVCFALIHLCVVIGSFYFDWKLGIICIFLIPAIAYFAIQYEYAYVFWLKARRVLKFKRKYSEKYNEIKKLRDQIINALGLSL